MADCPYFGLIQYCPLYVESHNARGLGCVDDAGKECKVERGLMKYQEGLRILRGVDCELVGQCAVGKMQHDQREQRERNMRLNGIH